jgi:hypothetical protein
MNTSGDLPNKLAKPYRKQLTDLQQREQMCQDQIRVLTDAITAWAKQRQQPYTLPGINSVAERSFPFLNLVEMFC